MPPTISVVPAQLHLPLLSVHVTFFQPRAVKAVPMLLHSMGADETDRHEGSSGNEIVPVVFVLST